MMRGRFLFWFGLLTVLAGVGCSTIQVRVQRQPADLSVPAKPEAIQSATVLYEKGLKADAASEKVGFFLESARTVWPYCVQGDENAKRIYRLSLREIVVALEKQQFPASIAIDSSPNLRELLLRTAGSKLLNPALAERLTPSADVSIRGLHKRVVLPGVGVPYAFCYAANSPFLSTQPGVPSIGMSLPATAVLTFFGHQATLQFYDVRKTSSIVREGRKLKLAADYSAPLALMVARSANRSLDIASMFLSRQRFSRAGLFQFQPYDPDKIPVIFIHGLISRPLAWLQALNSLQANPQIRSRYQFWFMQYPTGLPVWKSAQLLREELDRFRATLDPKKKNTSFNEIVLIGHSMGGLISSLVIREGGKHLWGQFSERDIEEMDLSPEARKALENMVFYRPRKDIGRVIFVATPHRGSRMAMHPVATFASRLIQLPFTLNRRDRDLLIQVMNAEARRFMRQPASSLRFLKEDSPLILSIQQLPMSRSIPYHSIIGDRGRGDSPNSSDGVVSYRSSHLPSAVSEKIVPADHGAQEHAEAIAEIERILLENLE